MQRMLAAAFGGMMKSADAKILKEADFKLNGETIVDDEFVKAPGSGILAFQLHAGGPMEVAFKDPQFTDLSKSSKK